MRESPETLRPRERLLQGGIEGLSNEEVLALILRSGRRGEDAIALGRRLLLLAEGVQGLKKWSMERLQRVEGVGPAKAASILASLNLAQRISREKEQERPVIRQPGDLGPLLLERLGDRPREVFAAAWLDGAHRLIAIDELFEGGINYASISSRIVVERALERRAVAVIVAHNHPSGSRVPSAEDRALTRTLKEALALVEIRLLDHLLVAAGEVQVIALA